VSPDMRFSTTMKFIIRLISIIFIYNVIAILLDIFENIRNGFLWVLISYFPIHALFYAINNILVLSLGPYAAFHLWKFRRKGRIASLVYIISLLFFSGYSLYQDQIPLRTFFIWLNFISTFLALLFLSFPSISRLFNPVKDGPKSWYWRIWKNISAMEALTVTISSLALIISFLSLFFAHIYKPDKLLATVTNISLANKEFSFRVVFTNSGSSYAVVQRCYVVLAAKRDLKKSIFEPLSFVGIGYSKTVPEDELILKPGEIKSIQVYSKPEFRHTIGISDTDDLFLATHTMDSKGKTYLKFHDLGRVQVKDGKIIGLKRNASILSFVSDGGTSASGEYVYGIIFKLH
jgi:hypothetical protein